VAPDARLVGTLLGIGAAWFVLATPGRGEAACGPPPPEILWSYPAAGAEDVPTDAKIWVLSGATVTAVRLDGLPVSDVYQPLPGRRWAWDPGPLAPSTDHELTVEFEGGATETLAFRTGAAPYAGAPASFRLDGIATTQDPGRFDPACLVLIHAQGCHDTGQDLFVRFEGEGDAIAYLLSYRRPELTTHYAMVLWPPSCGGPSVLTHSPLEHAACYRVHAIDPAGGVTSSEEACLNVPDEPGLAPPEEPSPACRLAPGTRGASPAAAALLLGMALVALRWRGLLRRRR
jgi:hypothetical protein